ncbi:MAG: hypothetical protein PUD79_01405 [Prevotellaceae bacterium]|nr:hypothetical protein [Prevotellaceae bacterium]
MNIHQIVFSPTGGTQRVSDYLCRGMGTHEVYLLHEVCVSMSYEVKKNWNYDDTFGHASS